MEQICQEILQEAEIRNIKNTKELDIIKYKICKKYKLKSAPKIIHLFLSADQNQREKLKSILITKPIRTLSGVAPLAIMTKPIACKHGKCTFCPGGPGSYFGDVTQSYTGNEPTSMRAIRNNYDPYLQVFNRLEHYTLLGQNSDKIELIVMGGTFPSFELTYQDYFVTYALKAMNDFSDLFYKDSQIDFNKFKEFFELPVINLKDPERTKKIHEKLLLLKKESTLEQEKLRNETSKIKCVVMNIETKPDWCFEAEINQMLKLGATRIEVGIQTLYDRILKITNRGHTLKDSIKSSQLLKDSFLKCCMHMMPGLPETTKDMDVYNFKELFADPSYRPDALKIYPTLVMPGTPLYEQYNKGQFKPLNTLEAAELLIELKKYVPEYCRIMRVLRDIPTKYTIDGVDITNFRQLVHTLMKKQGIECKCIRCREPRNKIIDFDNIRLLRKNYQSSGGQEIFLSYEDVKNNILLGFIRLRKPFEPFRKEIPENSMGIREIHTYGKSIPIGKKLKNEIQHRGIGKKLLLEAEKIAKEEFDAKKMLIISGIGVREYFYKYGYEKDGPYVSKNL